DNRQIVRYQPYAATSFKKSIPCELDLITIRGPIDANILPNDQSTAFIGKVAYVPTSSCSYSRSP
ncbi:hypothetical protein Lpp48_13739, partial [Lacticaseibacillus paracasei subsp. paracasei Lpp48]